MNIYSNSFFHRVSSSCVIEKILNEGFKVFYCKEEIYRGKNKLPTYIGIPMVSFCDLPLVHLAKNNYGKCGIAMSRRWGREKHLEPVLYYPNDVSCQSTKMIIKASYCFTDDRKTAEAYRILGYAKPMKKTTREKGRSFDNYAEREWRKVYSNPSPLKWLTESEYTTYRGNLNTEKKAVGTPLLFGKDDIDFILVNRDNLPALQAFIMTELNSIGGKSNSIGDEDRWVLLSKILVYEDLLHNL